MSQSASQAAAFDRDVARNHRVWTIRDAAGYPAPITRTGRRSEPFWSSLTRVTRIINNVPAYSRFEVVELSCATFRDQWLPELEADHYLVGVNWSGRSASGYDLEPDWVRSCVEQEIENLLPIEAVPRLQRANRSPQE